jgi:hypothetical protein
VQVREAFRDEVRSRNGVVAHGHIIVTLWPTPR